MQDGGLNRLRHVRAVQAGEGVGRDGGEADLVVDDQVDGAAGAVADELAHGQGFIDQALAGEGGVAMQQQGHDGAA